MGIANRICAGRLDLRVVSVIAALVVAAVPTPATANPGASSPGSVKVENTGRAQLLLDNGWRFHPGDAASPEGDFGFGTGEAFAKSGDAVGAARPDFADSTWRVVDLPHDWAVELGFVNIKTDELRDHGFKPIGRRFPRTSVGWYRKTFAIPRTDDGQRLSLKFDGVARDCIVWFNGHYLGRNLSGYGEFVFDITDYANYGGANVVVVRVDASQYEGWFYEGAGIYRHVWLLKHAPLHIPQHGTFVSTTVGESQASVNVETTVFNDQEIGVDCMLRLVVRDRDGRIAARTPSRRLKLGPFERKVVLEQVGVRNLALWSLEDPALYTVVSSVLARGAEVDRTETPFGIRTVMFDKDKGFFLNGKRVEIKGVCCHQDHAGVGVALPDRLQYFRIEKLKEMGCNAYRTSHNPPTPELLEACDRLGMLVMDENRLIGNTPEMLSQFETMILRDRNHPSVIIWSLGNEEWFIHGNETGRRLALSLKIAQRRLDPTRLCTYAANNGNQYKGINSVVDVRGFNYIVLGDPDTYHRDHPIQPVWGSEEASTLCTRGMYANDTALGYMSDYDSNAPGWGTVAEKWWTYYASRPWLAGAFVWTGFDYRGEPTPYAWPCINSHFGIMDVCGFPKNNYYYYQSWWSGKDVLHIAPHWNWPGKEGRPISVWCQSNCDSVELILNGESLGVKPMPKNSHLQWSVAYAPGKLEARGWREGRVLRTTVETAGSPVRLRLIPDRDTIRGDGEDVCVLTVDAVDEKGREVPVADNLVRFSLTGEGRIIGVGNGNPSSHEPDKYLDGNYQRRLFNGKCQLIVQSKRKAGRIELRGESDGLAGAGATVYSAKTQLRPWIH